MVRVAIAGSGDTARYVCEEFTKAGHELVILTRSHKPQLERPGVTQAVTDYSEDSLRAPLSDCDVLISLILTYDASTYIKIHRTLIKACQQSPKCKRFIPSEYGVNLEDFPDQPGFYWRSREPIREVLRNQRIIEWTLVSVGWLIDYIVPAKNRYLKDVGEAFPVDLAARKFVIPGTGKELVDVTWARDFAKGLAVLVNASEWDTYTYMSGEKTRWNDVADMVKRKYGGEFETEYRSLYKLIETIKNAEEGSEAAIIAEYQIVSPSGACSLPCEKVQAQRQKLFRGCHFRSVQEGMSETDGDSGVIV
ncbi:hypothetical protein BKA67DRAFT_522654 [Truncatella angustata]|uniref:NmrA-like domain-containing protein n=1 Tax=Truncatella angustata TaxID=152316 RepID=A0A9P8UFS5_9PEZI|nr:uncharacterized protein BKA67DRAFT_522654 [Truncatella angustata]KAH6649157.1 hypothetical protein BKA67DRAFT_522654 [Truncatella angustata]KAH8195938.1 hypothetical protein TruAng_009887 [Truncatella angustata]